MDYDMDEIEGFGIECVADVCPSCGTVLGLDGPLTEGCNDSLGCGFTRETQNKDAAKDAAYDECGESEMLEELNFDE